MPLTHSTETDKIDEALAKARGEYLPIEKGRTAEIPGKFSYDFADLSDVFAASSAALAKHAISVMQDAWVDYSEPVPRVSVQTRLALAGQWYESSVLTLPVTADSKLSVVQLIGSAESFGRRYQAIAMLAVQPKGDDDDGHGAGGTDATTEPKKERAPLPDCPTCKTNKSVIVGRAEFGGGFVCYKPKQGCGAKWQAPGADPQAIKDAARQQTSGEENQASTRHASTKPTEAQWAAFIKIVKECGSKSESESDKIIGYAKAGQSRLTCWENVEVMEDVANNLKTMLGNGDTPEGIRTAALRELSTTPA